MTNTLFARLAGGTLIVLALAGAGDAPAAAPPPANAIGNADIEAVAAGKPLAWNSQGRGARLAVDAAHSGRYALQIECPTVPPENDKWQHWRSEPFALPAATVKVSCWARAERVRDGTAMVCLYLLDAAGNRVDYQGHLLLYEGGTFAWSYFERYARLPAAATRTAVAEPAPPVTSRDAPKTATIAAAPARAATRLRLLARGDTPLFRASTAARAACALGNRSAGLFSRRRRTNAESHDGVSGRSPRGFRGTSDTCFRATSNSEEPTNGGRPVSRR